MKEYSKTLLWLAILSVVILGCNKKESDKVKITIKSTTQPNAEGKISLYTLLETVTICEFKTDSIGTTSF